ncbi:MAG TPA: MFS transporter [Ruminiclostridium sp.]
MNLTTKIKSIYLNKEPLTDKDMEMSRKISIFEGCTARTAFTLTSGAFLVGFAKYLGASDQIAGIIAAIPILSGIIMAFSPIILERIENRKPIISLFCLIGRLLLGSMILIPFMNISVQMKIVMLMIIFFVANLFTSFPLPAALAWIQSVTPEGIRGSYFGKRESIVLGVATIITLLIGQILDRFEQIGQQFNGFAVLYILVIIAAVANFILFSYMKEPKEIVTDVHLTLKKVLTMPLKNKRFMRVALLLMIWNFGFQLGFPFTSVYMVSTLNLRYGLITLMAVLASIISVVSVRFWGRVADRKSWLYLMKLMVILQILSFFVWFLINKYTVLALLPVAHIFSGAALSGINISGFNLQYIYSPKENKTIYLGFSAAISGIFGFGGTIVGSYLMKAAEKYSISILGFKIGNLQLLFLLSGIILLGCIWYVRYIVQNLDNTEKE